MHWRWTVLKLVWAADTGTVKHYQVANISQRRVGNINVIKTRFKYLILHCELVCYYTVFNVDDDDS